MDLYEFDEYKELPEGLDKKEFEVFLDSVWTDYQMEKLCPGKTKNSDDFFTIKKQRFITFKERLLSSRNFAGIVKYKGFTFNLYPKICKLRSKDEITSMLLLWLKHSKKIVFPHYEMFLSDCKCDFYEVFIFLFAKYTHNLFSQSCFQHYEEIDEESLFLKGKLDFKEYLSNIVSGKSHLLACHYDSFEFNNKFNQIVKYVSRLLFDLSKNSENKILLNEIIYLLNDVDDVMCSVKDCEEVYINRFMDDFTTVLDYCKLFLSNCVSYNSEGSLDTFAFLLRTETLFEEFVSNIIYENFQSVNRKILKQSKRALDNECRFSIMPDILVEEDNKITRIIDIKYKYLKSINDIAQADIYQCISYAYKLNCKKITLIFPLTQESPQSCAVNVNDIEIGVVFVNTFDEQELLSQINPIF